MSQRRSPLGHIGDLSIINATTPKLAKKTQECPDVAPNAHKTLVVTKTTNK